MISLLSNSPRRVQCEQGRAAHAFQPRRGLKHLILSVSSFAFYFPTLMMVDSYTYIIIGYLLLGVDEFRLPN